VLSLPRIGIWIVALAGLLASSLADAAQAIEPLSPRNANYRIEVTLDAEAKMLEGRQVLSWRNIQEQPTDELWFHLYWNAWRNDRSTWMLENRMARRRGRGPAKVQQGDWGWIEVDSVRLLADASGRDAAPPDAVDLSASVRFASPDDGNPDDRTVMVVSLPEAVGPGEAVRVEMTWRAKVPRTFARTGFRGDFFFIAHWFPKLGVFEPDGWNCHQYHATTEYYSDYGVYDVTLTTPESHVVGATGRRREETDNGDGTTTYRYHQADVHAFSWTSSPTYVVQEATFEEPGLPPVEVRLLVQREHRRQASRYIQATLAALKYYGTWFGPYPFGHVTVVDPAYGSGAGGMEYPTLFTGGTRLFNPYGADSPEGVTIHEAGHQFWYSIVGNNEFEHAWLDEGLNTYSTTRTLEAAYPDRVLVRRYLEAPGSNRRFFPLLFPSITTPRLRRRADDYARAALADDPALPTFRYFPSTASTISYAKTAMWLATLERHLGWETQQAILSTFFERFSFKHPSPEDFFAVANEVSGQDLSWFFDQVWADSVVFDYAVASVASYPAGTGGWIETGEGLEYTEPSKPDADDAPLYRSEVAVQRRGDGVFPVEVLLVFEDGHKQRHRWDGSEHWKLFVVERPAKLERIETRVRPAGGQMELEVDGLAAGPDAGRRILHVAL